MTRLVLTGSGLILLALCAAGLVGSWDDAALARAVLWIEQTNEHYDPTRIWISLAVLSVFLIWAGLYLGRHHPGLRGLGTRWSPILIGASLAVSPVYIAAHKGWFGGTLFLEDGAFEYLTVLLLFVSAGLGVAASRRNLFTTGEKRLLWFFAVALVLLAMEEMSWGQRILGIETPEALRTANVQGEINVHNLTVGWNEIVRMVLACIISTILLLLPRDAVPGLRGLFANLKPDGRFVPLIPLLILSHIYDEWFEQIVSFAILSYALGIYRHGKAPATLDRG